RHERLGALSGVGPIVVDTDRTAADNASITTARQEPHGSTTSVSCRSCPPPSRLPALSDLPRTLFDGQSQTIKLEVTVTPPGGDFGRYNVRAVLTDELSDQLVTPDASRIGAFRRDARRQCDAVWAWASRDGLAHRLVEQRCGLDVSA